MNWLQKIASKADFLFNKYRNKARAYWMQHFESDRSNDWSRALLLNLNNNDTLAERIYATADRYLKRHIQAAIEWNPKYADWLVGRIIAEKYPAYVGGSGMFYPFSMNTPKMQELNDYLTVGHGQIPSLNTTLDEAFILSDRWHKEMAEKAHQYKTHEVVSELSGGYQLVRVPKEDAQAEGYHMGHCVGSYCQLIASGVTEIMSIRDSNNHPHVTIELQPQTENIGTSHILGGPNFYIINQIQGKEDQAQPKYAPQVDEAINQLVEHGITLSNYAIEDYFAFQQDPDARRAMIDKIYAQPHIPHASPIFQVHDYAKQGLIPQDVLYEWLENHIDYMLTNYDIDKWIFFDSLMEDTMGRDMLLEKLDEWHRKFVVDDEDHIEEDDDTMTQDQYDKFYEAIQRGKVSHYDIPEALEGVIEEYIYDQERNNDEAIAEYYWQEEQDGIQDGYLNSLSHGTDMDIAEEYHAWDSYYRNQKEKVSHDHLAQLVIDAIQKHDIRWTNRTIGGPYGGEEPAYTIEKIVNVIEGFAPSTDWTKLATIEPYEVERALVRLEEQANTWWFKHNEYKEWAAQMTHQFPIFQQLNPMDQWRFYNIKGQAPLDDRTHQELQSFVGQQQLQQSDQAMM